MNKLIVNSEASNFYNHITNLLKDCKSFYFSVAFVNFSGVQLLLDSLETCRKKGIKGKILTSTYLNFTQGKALLSLLNFDNIELKIYDSNMENRGFHTKAYIFEYENEYKILLGSSNITASAFKTNIEWNIKSISKKDDIFTKEIFFEFNSLFENSLSVDEEFIKAYDEFCKKQVLEKFVYKKEFILNHMQKEAVEKLNFFRKNNQSKALCIAATGSGKTYLAAIDIKNFKAKRALFIVHRENILIKAKESFENIISNKSCGLYTGNKKELEKDYIFATIQTLSSNYENFSQKEFDYIVVDEAHHISANSYEKVIEYFKPSFLLGLTATPNRSDKKSIYDIFDENIACDIRLNDALENSLITPFHYYGISDIESIDYSEIDLSKIDLLAKLLMVNRRVDFIIEKMNFYGFSGNKRKALAFCVSKEHAFYMSEEFNKRGVVSTYLTSNDSIEKREKIIKELEDDKCSLQVIFSVDIFNEGIDIPSINTVLMLRPTNSAIIFVQQLGRGLRKSDKKEFLTLLDFIGNHKKAYLIAFALVGNKKIDKESIKLSILNNFANIKNAYISMDEISKNRILEQIDNENFNSMKYLKEKYFEFKAILGNKIATLEDYIAYDDFISPLPFISESRSYIEFLAKVEKKDEFLLMCKNSDFIKACRFLESLLPIKRVYEFSILKYLCENSFCDENSIFKVLENYLEKPSKESINHSFRFLNQEFHDSAQVGRFLKLVEFEDEKLIKTKEFKKLLENSSFKEYFLDLINYGILVYEKSFGIKDYGMPFLKLYESYNMLNIAKLCNFPKIHSSFRGSGFLKYQNDFFLFITIEKDKFSKASKYQNDFLDKERFTYISKPSMSIDKGDGEKLINIVKFGVKLHIFVRKFSHVDKKVQNFIYLGLAKNHKYKNNRPIELELKLEKPLSTYLFEEFTKEIK